MCIRNYNMYATRMLYTPSASAQLHIVIILLSHVTNVGHVDQFLRISKDDFKLAHELSFCF